MRTAAWVVDPDEGSAQLVKKAGVVGGRHSPAVGHHGGVARSLPPSQCRRLRRRSPTASPNGARPKLDLGSDND